MMKIFIFIFIISTLLKAEVISSNSNNTILTQFLNFEKTESTKVSNESTRFSNEIKKLNYYDYIWKSILCPGLGHYFLKRYTKALFFYTSFIFTTGLGIYFYSVADKTYQDYLKATTTSSAVSLYDDYIKLKNRSDTFFYFSIFIWAYSIFDVVLDVKWINDNLNLREKNITFNLYESRF